MKTLYLGPKFGLIRDDREMLEAIEFEIQHADEFGSDVVEQLTSVVPPDDTDCESEWSVWRDNYNHTESFEIARFATEAEARLRSAYEDSLVKERIKLSFASVGVPDKMNIHVGMVEPGEYPLSRKVAIEVGATSELFCWNARSVTDNDLPARKLALRIKQLSSDLQ